MLRAVAIGLAVAGPAAARTIEVSPGGFAAGVGAARDGDTVRLAPGEYYECAVVRRRDLVIEGPGAVLTDTTCGGKAMLVVQADGLTVRDLVLTRARVPDGNGAGIRLEAQGLALERVQFINNQVGVLAGLGGPGQIRIVDCVFRGGGVAGGRPTAAVRVDGAALLRIERSVFEGVQGGQVSSSAMRTELVGNTIGTGVKPGAAAAVLVGGGTLLMENNVLQVGPNPPPRGAAVVAMGDAATLRGNRLENGVGAPQTLLLDWMHADAVLSGNVVATGDSAVSSEGVWRHRVGGAARDAYGRARGMAGLVKRSVLKVLGR